jgi:hypothetical protein
MVLKGGTNCEMAPQIDYMTQVQKITYHGVLYYTTMYIVHTPQYIPYHAVCTVSYHNIPYHTSYQTISYHTILHNIIPYYTMPYTISYYTIPHENTPYHTADSGRL